MSWNVRGLGGFKKRRLVRACIENFYPDIVILQETKNKQILCRLLRSFVGMELSEWRVVPAIGTTRGILIAWNPIYVCKVDENLGNFSVSLHLKDLSLGVDWLILGVYGPSVAKNHMEFWEELSAIRESCKGCYSLYT